MRIEIHHANLRPSDSLGETVERRIVSALGRLAHRIRDVSVWIADTNGPRGGADKSCRVQVRLAHGPALVVAHVSHDPYQAASGAVDRAGRAVQRRVDRSRDRRRRTDR
ncbi:MAG: HPF/RaiA family ribosome-associated protein [Phycisphaerales bacterium]